MRSLLFFTIVALSTIGIEAWASNFLFTPIQSYTYDGDNGLGSFGVSEDVFTVPGTGGLVSDFPISLAPGVSIEFDIKGQYEISSNGKWIQKFEIGFFKNRPNADKTIRENQKHNNFIIFNIYPNLINDPRYKGAIKSNFVKSNIGKSIHENKANFYDHKTWNKIKIDVISDKEMKLSINGKESLTYKGKLINNGYFFIGENLVIQYLIKRDISINGEKGGINLKF